jgi:hypothetical protein
MEGVKKAMDDLHRGGERHLVYFVRRGGGIGTAYQFAIYLTKK